MRTILTMLIFFAILSLSTEDCTYKRNTHINVIDNKWWINREENVIINRGWWTSDKDSDSNSNAIFCSTVSLNDLSTQILSKTTCDDYRDEYDYCEDVGVEYFALILINSNVSILSEISFEENWRLEGIKMYNSQIKEIRGNAFNDFTNLVELNLSMNNISFLPDGLFSLNNKLKIIDLSNNIISSVENTTFLIQNLRHLSIQNNKLQKLDFKLPETLISLDVSFNSIAFILKDFFTNSKELNMISLRNNKLHTLAAGLFTANINLQMVDLSYNNITTVGNIIFYAHHLEVLHMQCNNMEKFEFALPYSLKILDLSYNRIRRIAPNRFSNVTQFLRLKINNNYIAEIPELFNSPVKQNNINTNFFSLNKRLFEINNKLNEINLAYNSISTIAESTFSSQNTDLLILTNNKLQYVNFSLPQSLIYLDLSSNLIRQIDELIFLNTTNLKEIYLNKNALKSIPAGLFSSLDKVSVIHLEDNNIIMLPSKLFSPHLRENLRLNISNNSISLLNDDTFPPYGITHLYLQHNKLENINFTLPRSLYFLDLSSNSISMIENNPFVGLTSLRTLWLTNNFLTEIPAGYFRTLNNLKSLHLSNNSLNVTFGTLNGLKNLAELDLANNSIIHLQESLFIDLENILSIDISNNLLTSFEITNLVNKSLKKLKTVYLNDNRFECLYLWKLIKRLENIGINVPKGNKFYESNVNGIECFQLKETGGRSTNITLPNISNENIMDNKRKRLIQFLKEVLSDLRTNKTWFESTSEKNLVNAVNKVNSNLDFANKVYNAPNEQFDCILKKLRLSITFTKEIQKTSFQHMLNTLEKTLMKLWYTRRQKKYYNTLHVKLKQGFEQIISHLNHTGNMISNRNTTQLRYTLDFFRSNSNFTAHIRSISYGNFVEHIKKIEDILVKLNKTRRLFISAKTNISRMLNMDTAWRNTSFFSQQHNVYSPLQTSIWLGLLFMTICISCFLYRKFKSVKVNANIQGSMNWIM